MPLFTGKIETHSSFRQLLGTFKVTLRYLRKLDKESFPVENNSAGSGKRFISNQR